MGGGSNERKRGGSKAVGTTGGAGGWAEWSRQRGHQKLRVSRKHTSAWQRRGQWEEKKTTLLGRRGGKEREKGGLEEKS